MLKVSGLNKSYKKRHVVKDVSFQVDKGEMCVLSGTNGSGKTTIAHMITDLTHKDSGKVKISGYDLDKEFKNAISRVGMCFDRFILFEDMSGYDNLKLSANLCGKNDSDIDILLNQFDLNQAAKDKVKNYSSGMKQKLSIARAIIKKPDLLIMDEPANMLDRKSCKEFYRILSLFKEQGMSILIITHLLSEIDPYVDSVVFIKDGSIRLAGKLKDIKRQENKSIEELYDECLSI